MNYKFNQMTQLGRVTDDMLKKLMVKKKEGHEAKEKKDGKQQLNKQIDHEKLKKIEAKQEVHDKEYINLKKRDNRLAIRILNEERKELESQIMRYKTIIQEHEIGQNDMTAQEMISVYKLYQHLMQQKQQLEEQMIRYDEKLKEKFKNDQSKEKMIKRLQKKYSHGIED